MAAKEKTPLAATPEDWQICRTAFVVMIKQENFEGDKFGRQSLRADWTGPKAGFRDQHLQTRWLDFKTGWEAHRKNSTTSPRPPAVITGCIKK